MYNKSILICISLAFIVGGLVSRPINVRAENRLFITGITLAAGEDAYDSLEDAGYHVLSVGLNVSVAGEKQVYIGFKLNEGKPVTNILIAKDAGKGFDTDEGIHYELASDIDVDKGLGGGTGKMYITRDKRAGDPLVGILGVTLVLLPQRKKKKQAAAV